jgi:hypothetical protein
MRMPLVSLQISKTICRFLIVLTLMDQVRIQRLFCMSYLYRLFDFNRLAQNITSQNEHFDVADNQNGHVRAFAIDFSVQLSIFIAKYALGYDDSRRNALVRSGFVTSHLSKLIE